MNIDYEGLEAYLKNLKAEDYRDAHNRNPKIEEANTIDELNRFGYTGTLLSGTIINYGEYFLVDYLGNDLSVVMLTKRAYKNNRGRKVKCKLIRTIIEDCKEEFGTCLNGYWTIPKQFIKEG